MNQAELTILKSSVAEHVAAFRALCSDDEREQVKVARKLMREALKTVPQFEALEAYQVLLVFIEEFTDFALFVTEERTKQNASLCVGKTGQC